MIRRLLLLALLPTLLVVSLLPHQFAKADSIYDGDTYTTTGATVYNTSTASIEQYANYSYILQSVCPAGVYDTYSNAVSASTPMTVSTDIQNEQFTSPPFNTLLVITIGGTLNFRHNTDWSPFEYNEVYSQSPTTVITALFTYDGSTFSSPFSGSCSTNSPSQSNVANSVLTSAFDDSNYDVEDLKIITNSNEVNYPSGYAGSSLDSTPTTVSSTYMPRYSLSIVKQDIDLSLLSASGDPPDYKYAVGLYRCADLSDSYDTCDITGDHVIYEGIQNKGPTDWTYHVDSQGHYQLYILMVKPDTTSFDEPDNMLDDSGFYALKIDIDGGVYTLSSDDTSQCTTSTDTGRTQMICSGATFAACTLNTTDVLSFIGSLPDYIPCQIGNLGKLLQSAFYILFVPSAYSMDQFHHQVDDWAQSHLGALYEFFSWFNSLIPRITDTSHAVVCEVDFGLFFGQQFVFNQCVVEDNYPAIWGVIVLVVRSTVVFAVLLMIYQKVRYIIGASKEVG